MLAPNPVLSYLKGTVSVFGDRTDGLLRTGQLLNQSHEAVCWQRGPALRTLSRLHLLIKTIMVWILKKLGMAQMDIVLLVCRKLINIYYEL